MTTLAIITALLPLIQNGPALVQDILNLFKGNPQNAGETDADYIARIHAQIAATDAQVQATDAEIQK
jgi:hypothetical protein